MLAKVSTQESRGRSAEGNAWFPQLSAIGRAEVVKYAILHTAWRTPKRSLSKSASSAKDADPEVGAKDADPEGELRKFFQNVSSADPSDGVTGGTLLNVARQYGADFTRWEKTSAGSRNDVLFAPGKEDECRKHIDRVVAADPQTFTLGDPTGPLVILRVPKQEQLPSSVKWDGDLPGTTLAMTADIMQRAERLAWAQRAGGKSETRFVRTGPPRTFVGDYLTQMRGQYGAAP